MADVRLPAGARPAPGGPTADEHDRAWLAHVRPDAHVNPLPPPGRYNLVVIGAGPAGLVAAAAAAGLGARVALVERHLMGGDCLNVGCVPSKALLRAARAAAEVRRAHEFGVRVSRGAAVDFPAVMERMRRLRAGLARHDAVARFRGLGVDVYLGAARFAGPDCVEVDGRRLRFARAVIATGSRAAMLPVPGLAEAEPLTNETVFSLATLPRRLAVLGAGPLGCELGQAFLQFGSAVTILARDVLPQEDPDAAALVAARLRRDGATVVSGATLLEVRRQGPDRVIAYEAEGRRAEAVADAILLGAGRVPNVEGLDLEAAGIAYTAEGITVDGTLRTTNPRVFAAGDVCARFRFTHAADAMARLVVQNALFFGRRRHAALHIPRCTYTMPEIAHVGLTAREAAAAGIAAWSFTVDLAGVDRAVLDGATEGFARAVVRAGSDRLLGVTIVAEHAGEMIGEAVLALGHGIGLGGLSRAVHPYPTQAEALRKLGDAWVRARLTPTVQRLFRWLLALRRL